MQEERLSGDSAYAQMAAPADVGFVAGTLVHTQNGLVPIEQIKVGDMVLSQPQEKGATAYKHVLRTFVHGNCEVLFLRYDLGQGVQDHVAVTAERPFFVKGRGWTEAGKIKNGNVLELQGGREGEVVCREYIQQTLEPNVGWLESAWGFTVNDGGGFRIHFGERSIALDEESTYNWEIIDKYEEDEAGRRLRTRVYNFEVEDFLKA
jgi:hypothetical protein